MSVAELMGTAAFGVAIVLVARARKGSGAQRLVAAAWCSAVLVGLLLQWPR